MRKFVVVLMLLFGVSLLGACTGTMDSSGSDRPDDRKERTRGGGGGY